MPTDMFTAILLHLLVAFAACSPSSSQGRTLAPLHNLHSSDAIPGEYIVLFHSNHTYERHWQSIGRNLSTTPRFYSRRNAYRAVLDDHTRDHLIRRDPGVQLVETNAHVHLPQTQHHANYDPTNSTHRFQRRAYELDTAPYAPYGLRVLAAESAEEKPTIGSEDADILGDLGSDVYDVLDQAGQGVNVYVMDSGIRVTHNAFDGRAVNFNDIATDQRSPYCSSGTMADDVNHGTTIAGTIGAEQFGVAPHVQLVNVKVACPGADYATFGTALADIVDEHNKNKAETRGFRGSVINVSVAWKTYSPSVLAEIQRANAAGISIYVAASRDGLEDFKYPCVDEGVKCIGSVDRLYQNALHSSSALGINFVAPGVDIFSISNEDDDGLRIATGPCSASAHASGAAAIFTSWKRLVDGDDRSEIYIIQNALENAVTGFGDVTPMLINTGINLETKSEDEPFKFAGEEPADDPDDSDDEDDDAPASAAYYHSALTTFATMTTTTLALHSPTGSIESGSSSLSDFELAPGSTVPGGLHKVVPSHFPVNGSVSAIPKTGAPVATPAPLSSSSSPEHKPPPATSASGRPQSSATACRPDQPDRSCTAPTIPTSTPDSGPQKLVCNDIESGDYRAFDSTKAYQDVHVYCASLIKDKVSLRESNHAPEPGYAAAGTEDEGTIEASVEFDVSSCDPGTSTEDQFFDFSEMEIDTCMGYLFHNITATCQVDPSSSDYESEYPFSGGTYAEKCARFSLSGQLNVDDIP